LLTDKESHYNDMVPLYEIRERGPRSSS